MIKTLDIAAFCRSKLAYYNGRKTALQAQYDFEKMEFNQLPWYKKLVSCFDENDFKYKLKLLDSKIKEYQEVLNMANYYIYLEPAHLFTTRADFTANKEFWGEFFSHSNLH